MTAIKDHRIFQQFAEIFILLFLLGTFFGKGGNFHAGTSGKFVEIQATAEHQVFDDESFSKMIGLARQGIQFLIGRQQAILNTLQSQR